MKFTKYVEEINAIAERASERVEKRDDMNFYTPFFKGMALGVFYMAAKECFPEEERKIILEALAKVDEVLDRRFLE